MRTRFNNSEIVRVWAKQTQYEGKATSMFFNGPTIYSFGRHFPMAKIVKRNGKPYAAIITTRTYSVTTAHHLSQVRGAVRHLKCFYADDINGKPRDILDDYQKRIGELTAKLLSARAMKRWYLMELDLLIVEANGYAEFVKSTRTFTIPTMIDIAEQRVLIQRYEVRQSELRTTKQERHRAASRLQYNCDIATYPAKLLAWQNGESDKAPRKPVDPDARGYQIPPPTALLRIRGSRIETNEGAVVQISDAMKLLPFIRGTSTEPLPTIGGYRTSEVNRDNRTVRIGCHTLAFDELERVAKLLNV